MAQVLVTESHLANIADAIREKNGLLAQYTPGQMAGAIEAIPASQEPVLVTKSITENGTYSADDDDADGYSSVTVNVAGQSGLLEGKRTYNGYITGGTFYNEPSDSFSLVVFPVENGHTYLFSKGAYGNRWRFAFFTVDITKATGTVNGSGLNLDTTNEAAFQYKASNNGYAALMAANNDGSLEIYGMDIT